MDDYSVKLKESEKRDKYKDLARELKKTLEHENDGNSNCNWNTKHGHQRIGTGTGGLGNRSTSRDLPGFSIVKIGENTKKSPGDLRRHAVT